MRRANIHNKYPEKNRLKSIIAQKLSTTTKILVKNNNKPLNLLLHGLFKNDLIPKDENLPQKCRYYFSE